MSLKNWKLLRNICFGIIVLEFVYLFMFIPKDFVFDKELFRWLGPLNILLFNPTLIVDIKNRNSKDYNERDGSISLIVLILSDFVALSWLIDGF